MKALTEKRYELITRGIVEIIEPNELLDLLEKKARPVIYHGFEPSSKAIHIGYLIGLQKHLDFIEAGLKLIILFADLHAWLNEKGSWEEIARMTQAYKKNFLAFGIPKNKVKFVTGTSFQLKRNYWLDVMRLALRVRMLRAKRSMTIIGRQEDDPHVAQFLYPLMQVTDIKHLAVDIAFGDLAQRKVHMIAREELEAIGYKKPICLHHAEMAGLTQEGKMSSSKPETTIFVTDSPEKIEKKILEAYCEPAKVENNPILQIVEYIIFGRIGLKEFKVEREARFGGDVIYKNYQEVRDDYEKGLLHPLDLKKNVARELIKILAPMRKKLLGAG
ncbi:MAG: tyrosine--tRNA ligase [Candidatus Pacearchaeota archaeon]